MYLEPKPASGGATAQTFTLRATNKDIAILRTHVHHHALPDPGTILYQLLGPDPGFSVAAFEKSARYLANLTPREKQDELGCVGDLPLLIEVRYIARGKMLERIGFYHLAYSFTRTKEHPEGLVSIVSLEFDRELPAGRRAPGHILEVAPCDWTDTGKVKRDWSLVR